MPKIIAVVNDLMFSSKISATGAALRIETQIVREQSALVEALKEDIYKVFIDLNNKKLDPFEAIKLIQNVSPSSEVIAFFSHVDIELKRKAEEAGISQILPRSQFTIQLAELMRG